MEGYDPFSPEVIRGDKYRVYRWLRDEAPAYHVEKWDCWVLSRFQDVWDACMDAESYSAARGTTTAHLLTKVQPVTPLLNVMDPPDHTRLRAELRKFFLPRRVREQVPTIQGFIRKGLDALRDRDRFDLVSEFAQPLASDVAASFAGFPGEDGDYLHGLVQRFFERDPESDGMTSGGVAALDEMHRYFAALSAKCRERASSVHDPIAVLQQFEVGGKKLDDETIASHLGLLLIGGTDTFPKVFANLLYRLFEHPGQRVQVAEDPELALPAFNEALRIDMPTQLMCRMIVKQVQLHGQTLRPGQPILFLYASGNRDEREFEDPDVFDIHRRPPRALSFGHGIHACIGLHVARMEGLLGVREILARSPEYVIEPDGLERYRTEFVQGYSTMPMRWAA